MWEWWRENVFKEEKKELNKFYVNYYAAVVKCIIIYAFYAWGLMCTLFIIYNSFLLALWQHRNNNLEIAQFFNNIYISPSMCERGFQHK